MTHELTVDEEQRQLIVMALAYQVRRYPGFAVALREAAARFPGGGDMFDAFRQIDATPETPLERKVIGYSLDDAGKQVPIFGPAPQLDRADLALLRQEREAILDLLHLYVAEANPLAAHLLNMLGVNAYRLTLNGDLPEQEREGIRADIEELNTAHRSHLERLAGVKLGGA